MVRVRALVQSCLDIHQTTAVRASSQAACLVDGAGVYISLVCFLWASEKSHPLFVHYCTRNFLPIAISIKYYLLVMHIEITESISAGSCSLKASGLRCGSTHHPPQSPRHRRGLPHHHIPRSQTSLAGQWLEQILSPLAALALEFGAMMVCMFQVR